ncbi:MAG: family 16 glycoside hydrolase [Opitutaceae bacterium]
MTSTAKATASAPVTPSTSPQTPAPKASPPQPPSPLGYTDTPIIPGTPWRVHDGVRPAPAIVTPGATFSHLAPPPSDAVVLFDGKNVSRWSDRDGGDAKWKLNDGALESVRGTGMIRTRDKFTDFQLHLEFATPATVEGNSQGRGNSGVMINGMYEVQILDSYENPTYPDGQAAALYGQYPPLVNASKPPGQWQTYEIVFESPRWNPAGELVKKAAVTVIHNGVVVQHRREYFGRTDGIGGTAHKTLGTYGQPHPPAVFIELQDHNNPVRFRNIWIRELRLADAK